MVGNAESLDLLGIFAFFVPAATTPGLSASIHPEEFRNAVAFTALLLAEPEIL